MNDLARASLVCGSLAVAPACCCGPAGLPLSIAAIVMGVVAVRQIDASGGGVGNDRTMAMLGAIFGSVSVLLDLVSSAYELVTQVR